MMTTRAAALSGVRPTPLVASILSALLVAVGGQSLSAQLPQLLEYPPTAVQPHSDTIVRPASAPVHPRGGALVEEISIGGLNVPLEYTFGRSINEIAVRSDGAMFVIQGTPSAIMQYDAAGKFVRQIGRVGQGPGEYGNPVRGYVSRDGELRILDGGGRRAVQRYDRDGKYIGLWPIPAPGPVLYYDTAGYSYVYAKSPMQQEQVVLLARLGPDGQMIDTVVVPGFPTTPRLVDNSPSRSLSLPVPFEPFGTWVWSPAGYLVTGHASQYAINLHFPPALRPGAPANAANRGGTPVPWKPGDPVVSIRRSGVVPAPVTAAERDSARAALEVRFRAGSPPPSPNWVYKGPEIPRVKAVFTQIKAGQDGRLWVKRENGTDYDVFEPDGRFLGQVSGPPLALYTARGDIVWAVVTDADDVKYVKRYRVAWR